MSDLTREQRTIAAGGTPSKKHTATHPVHGELVFTFRLPLAVDSLRHSVEVDNLLQDLSPGTPPSYQTTIFASAIAGLTVPDGNPSGKGLMIDLPVVDETREETEAGSKVTLVYYDVHGEADINWLTQLWLTFSAWRGELLSDATVRAVGESSGGPSTSSGASSTPSAAATEPPSQTPAS